MSLSLTTMDLRRHGAPLPIESERVLHEPSRVFETVKALNKLGGHQFMNSQQQPHRPPTAVQSMTLQRIGEAVDTAGPCPEDLDGPSSLRELMRSHNQYGDPNNLATFEMSKLKILRSKLQPKSLDQLLPPNILPILNRKSTMIERDPQEVANELSRNPHACPKAPYWDPVLRHCPHKRAELIAGLARVGVIGFRRSIKSQVGLFFVKKKDPAWIRMVIDARIANFHHKDPPTTRLGSCSSYVDLELSDDALMEKFPHMNPSEIGYGAELDVADCFWQFRLDSMAEWFGIQFPKPMSFWKQFNVGDHGYSDNDVVFPVIAAIPMGWKWSLFFANEVVASIGRQSCLDRPLEMRERLPTPQLWEGDTILSTYVDNVAIIGATKQAVQQRIEQVTRDFEKLDIPVVLTYDEPVRQFETVGICLDFAKRRITNKPRRVWRVHLAGLELCRRRKVLGSSVEVWLGHVTSLFRLAPHLLSVFDKIYRFVMVCREHKVALWPSVRKEIKMASSLVWLAFSELGGTICRNVDMGDSSDRGYAMMTRQCNITDFLSAIKFREKWRFLPLPENIKTAMERNTTGDAAQQAVTDAETDVFLQAGAGLDTEYGAWLREALREGSWLRTSSIVSQYRAKTSSRVDVEIPALVKPLSGGLVDEKAFRLLWSRAWKWPDEHINIKEGRVLISSLKRASRVTGLFGCKLLTISDNLSAVLCFENLSTKHEPFVPICGKSHCCYRDSMESPTHRD